MQRSKTVVVHRGARDAYQVARALAEAGLLESLVTDLYWPSDRVWARCFGRLIPDALKRMLLARYAEGLPSSRVRLCLPWGPASFLLDKLPGVPFARRKQAQRTTDAALGRFAGKIAEDTNSRLLSYSYYGYHAFSNYSRPGILFQVHPHPLSVRKILMRELEDHPECSDSLKKEWELALPPEDFQHLTAETEMASRFICASSFTRQTLIENGTAAESIHVIPYGVNLDTFLPSKALKRSSSREPFRILFVGTINQRKGIKYLLEALRLLNSRRVELIVCGRAVDDLEIFRPFGSQVQIRRSISLPDLVRAYQEANLFVFPSLAEGFAQVLLEALSCGLPILSTTHTAAPDLIDEGIQGFIIPPKRPDLIAARIEWCLDHPRQLDEMRIAARRRAEFFTWARFRAGIVRAVESFDDAQLQTREALTTYV